MPPLRIRYTTIEIGSVDIHIRMLRDTLQYLDDSGAAEKLGISSAAWPMFGVIWPSGEVLAHHMLDYNVEGKHILEIGCGIGLASLVLNHRLADITATDHHPETEQFLIDNVNLNNGRKLPFVRTGWCDLKSTLGTFDLIIGSDLLYESDHALQLSQFIDQHAKSHCEVIIVDPGRGNHANFSKKMVMMGYSHHQEKPAHTNYLKKPFKGQILSYVR